MQLPFSTSRTADAFLQEDRQCGLHGAFGKEQCSGEAEGSVTHHGPRADSPFWQKMEAGLCTKPGQGCSDSRGGPGSTAGHAAAASATARPGVYKNHRHASL